MDEWADAVEDARDVEDVKLDARDDDENAPVLDNTGAAVDEM